MTSFHLTITAPQYLIFNDPAVYCKVTTLSGSIGIEAHHEPFLALLKENSSVTYKDESGAEKSILLESGLLSFFNNKCNIAVSLAPGEPKD
ncbi:MAG: F0F1 ATP synthase subunit epsilon [Spirochaetales bacterium]|nr:F0F1 ATP synthase subunit epsilon [Spirochaetales bacterium]